MGAIRIRNSVRSSAKFRHFQDGRAGRLSDYTTGSAVTNSANGKPNSNAFIIEADWVPFGKADSWGSPWANLKLGVQYTLYTQFNGGNKNYDGFGRGAGDNNTLFLFAWMAF
jgi:hypothetical protein